MVGQEAEVALDPRYLQQAEHKHDPQEQVVEVEDGIMDGLGLDGGKSEC